MSKRLPALDWMRGIVMVLMTTDHASTAFNSGRLVTDSVFMYSPDQPLGAIQFLHRWISHLCAPTFLFLALLFRVQERVSDRYSRRNPDLVFGQTGFFFYITHIALLEAAARAVGMFQQRGLAETTVAGALSLIALYPIYLWYRGFKSRNPQSVLRYL